MYMTELDRVLKEVFHNAGKVIAPLVGGMMNQSYIVSYQNTPTMRKPRPPII